ncbi:hypothetical protein AMELA_G00177270, partial [Ameiurus melas]
MYLKYLWNTNTYRSLFLTRRQKIKRSTGSMFHSPKALKKKTQDPHIFTLWIVLTKVMKRLRTMAMVTMATMVDAWTRRSKPLFQLLGRKIRLIRSPRMEDLSGIKLIRT